MRTYELIDSEATTNLIEAVYSSDEPLAISKDGDECLIAMTPEVFERILFEDSQLAACDRVSLRL